MRPTIGLADVIPKELATKYPPIGLAPLFDCVFAVTFTKSAPTIYFALVAGSGADLLMFRVFPELAGRFMVVLRLSELIPFLTE